MELLHVEGTRPLTYDVRQLYLYSYFKWIVMRQVKKINEDNRVNPANWRAGQSFCTEHDTLLRKRPYPLLKVACGSDFTVSL
jgi:hypothetical protein